MKPFLIQFLHIVKIYLFICIAIYFIQNYLIYFPNTDTYYHKDVWTVAKDQDKIIGLQTSDNYDNVVIVFHGNAGNANNRAFYKALIPENYNLIVVEYPGFGLNHEDSANKDNIIKQARLAMTFIQSKHPKNFYLIGESLGSGIASQMAVEYNISKLLLITPYSSIQDVAQSKFWYLPVGFLLNNNYDNIENLKKYKGNTLIVMSEEDEVIPPKLTLKLAKSINVKPIIIEKASHNEWLAFSSETQFKKIKEFLF